jgi:arylsulfatase A-like enzyme
MYRFIVFCSLAFSSLAVQADQRPNFILMIADDMAVEDCGAMGHPHIQTPNLDRLASQGVVFDRAFLTCSSCSPSRSSIITCKYPHQTDAEQLHWPLPDEQVTFVELLRGQGYYTAASGKWHLGNPAKDAFDMVQEASSVSFQLPSDATATDSPVMADANNASGCAGWVQTLENAPDDKPFFLWLAALDPHRDYLPGIIRNPHHPDDVVLPPFIPDTPEVRADFALYYDEISRLDSYVGAVLDALDASGRASNTYVIFISDNGRPFPRCKTTVLDSGIQTPMFIRCPDGANAGQRSEALVSSIDIGMTLLELAGVQADPGMMGRSFGGLLDNPQQTHRDAVFAEHNWHDYDAYQRAVRTKQYKYIRNFDADLTLSPPADAVRSPTYRAMQELRDANQLTQFQQQCFVAPRSQEELYDLSADPYELVNLADSAEMAETLALHRRLLDQWRIDTEDASGTQRAEDEFDRETGKPLENRQRPRAGKFDGFQSMFPGPGLEGWQLVNTDQTTWKFEDGVLYCTGKPIGELRTERMYQNFILELQWRHMVPGGNAGIFVWADDIPARGVPFHRGIEVQVLENAYGNTESHTTHGDIFPIHGAKMTPLNGRGGGRAFPTEMRSKPAGEWNDYRIVCNDGEISLSVNGKFVTHGQQCLPKKGYICLESEGGVVQYRNIRIKELVSTPIAPAEIASKDRGFRALYRGINLHGWQTESAHAWEANDWKLVHQGGQADGKQTISTQTGYGRCHVIVDVNRQTPDSQFEIAVGDVSVASDQPPFENSVSEPGGWDRFELIRDGSQSRVRINGEEVRGASPTTAEDSASPLSITATGPVQFANIFVRSLDDDLRPTTDSER